VVLASRFGAPTNEITLQMQAAQEQTKALSEELLLESQARETAEEAHEKAANRAAEAAQKLAEQINATKALSEKLVLEGKARETAEEATRKGSKQGRGGWPETSRANRRDEKD